MLVIYVSWLGALLVLIAFALNIRKIIKPEDLIYILLNLFGALFLAISAFVTKGYAFAVLNSVWFLFALYSLTKSFSLNSRK